MASPLGRSCRDRRNGRRPLSAASSAADGGEDRSSVAAMRQSCRTRHRDEPRTFFRHPSSAMPTRRRPWRQERRSPRGASGAPLRVPFYAFMTPPSTPIRGGGRASGTLAVGVDPREGGPWHRARDRRSGQTTSAACCARRSCSRRARSSPPGRTAPTTARGRGRRDPRRGEDAGGRGSPARHRRRVPARVMAHGLHLRARWDTRSRRTSPSSSTTPTATSSSPRPRFGSATR